MLFSVLPKGYRNIRELNLKLSEVFKLITKGWVVANNCVAIRGCENYYLFPFYDSSDDNRKMLKQALNYLPDFIHNVKGDVISFFERALLLADGDFSVFSYVKDFHSLNPMKEFKRTTLFFLKSSGWERGNVSFSFRFIDSRLHQFVVRKIPAFCRYSIEGRLYFEQRVSGIICGDKVVLPEEVGICRCPLLMPFTMRIKYEEKNRVIIADSEVQIEYSLIPTTPAD